MANSIVYALAWATLFGCAVAEPGDNSGDDSWSGGGKEDGVIRPFDRCDAGGPCPDLRLNASVLQSSIVIESRMVPSYSCSLNEGTILAPGLRRLLRFTTSTTNIGTGNLFLGNPETGDPKYFEYAECHGHYHFKGYADYKLKNLDGTEAAIGHKESFCIEDNAQGNGKPLPPRPTEPLEGQPALPDTWTPAQRTYCHHPGLHRGWTDAYYSTTEGNWIDITDVPPGDYTLSVSVNPEKMIAELNYDNNSADVAVHVPASSADGAVCPASSDAIFRCTADGTHRTKCFKGVTTTEVCPKGCGQPQEIAHFARCL
ncbi:MAG: hypothetical protein JWO36_6374 [Myxococcales bacterium]|nr:hypothetical protein [Myxococcales bacterium]